jgi:hypothetical protein
MTTEDYYENAKKQAKDFKLTFNKEVGNLTLYNVVELKKSMDCEAANCSDCKYMNFPLLCAVLQVFEEWNTKSTQVQLKLKI